MTGGNEFPVYQAPDYPETYGNLIDWAVKRVAIGEKIFLRMSGTDVALTYSQFQDNVNRIGNLLSEAGLRKGDHIAVYLSNCTEYAYLYHSLGKIGAVMSPINPFVRGEPLKYILNHSDSEYLITTGELFEDKIKNALHVLTKLKCIFFMDEAPAVKGLETVPFSKFRDYSPDFEPRQKVTGDDIQGIWYTSGTTGVPKGAVINHKTYLYRIIYFSKYFRLSQDDVIYYILPMFHVGFAVWGGPLAMAAGAGIVQVPWFSAGRFWPEIVQYRATMTLSTGTIIPIMLKQAVTPEEEAGVRQLRVWVGWPVDDPQAVTRRWPNVRFMEAYGTTEAPVGAIADYDNPVFGAAGPPTDYTVLKIIDPQTGAELPPGQVGEIVYGHKQGPDYITTEYYKDAGKTKAMIRNGYWYSGDLGFINKKGHLKFSDRLKDYLRVGGENVSSAVVEGIIRGHPAVMDVAIVGVKGDLGHDEIAAHVVLKENASLEPREFFEFCNQNMAYFMVPRFLIVRPELPKTSTMRTEKYKLREEGIPSQAIDRNSLGIVLKR